MKKIRIRLPFSRRVAEGLLSVLLVTICFVYNVNAQSGDLDTSFSFDGKVTTGFGIGSDDEAEAIAIQSDGKIVVGGDSDADGSDDFALARYNTDGSLDNSFGPGGVVLTDFGVSSDGARALAIQTDGKIVAAGDSDADGSNDYALARYNTDGSLDISFGSGGVVLTDFSGGANDIAFAMAIQSDGKIVAAGRSNADGSNDFALARYNTDGSLDMSFGTGGLVLTDFSGGGSNDDARALAIQTDGKIVAAGRSNADGSNDFALARYDTDGSLDIGFGSGGIVVTDFSGGGSNDQARSMAIQTDGKIVVGGFSNADGDFDFALSRYNSDGSLDIGFGSGGVVLTDFSGGGSDDSLSGLVIQLDAKIVAAGTSDADGSDDFALARYNTDGSLDNGFGSSGLVLTDFSGSGSFDSPGALATQSDGKIVVAGESDASGNGDFALARYLDSAPTPTPTPTPTATPEPQVKGDANLDGSVTSADITCTILGIFGLPCPMPDCNEDGMTTSADITCVIAEIFNQP